MRALLLLALASACGTPRTPTPGGLVVFYDRGEDRLPEAKARELDARYAAVRECLPPDAYCRTSAPTFAIEGDCDWFWDGDVKVRGYTYMNGTRRIVLPGSLGAAAHEMVHYFTCEADIADRAKYKTLWLYRCGDLVDGAFRKLYPPTKCEGDR